MTIEVVIPTYQRLEKLARCVRSIINNNYLGTIITILPDHDRVKCFQLINEQSFRSKADIFIGISDDTEFTDSVLSVVAAEMLIHFPGLDGAISLPWLNIPNVTPGAVLFLGRALRARFPRKYIYCPDYISFYADKELGDFLQQKNLLFQSEATGLFHYHPGHFPNEYDETHWINRETQGKDKKTQRLREAQKLLWGKTFKRITIESKEVATADDNHTKRIRND